MIMVEKKLVDSLPPTVVGHHSDSSEAQNLLPGEKSSSSDGSSSSPPHQSFAATHADRSRFINKRSILQEFLGFFIVMRMMMMLRGRKMVSTCILKMILNFWSGLGDRHIGIVFLLPNFSILLWTGVGAQPEVYHVEVNGDSCTVEECLKLLKEIACESRFIACSVEDARLFFAELNKDEAAKLKGVNGICSVYPRGDLLFDI